MQDVDEDSRRRLFEGPQPGRAADVDKVCRPSFRRGSSPASKPIASRRLISGWQLRCRVGEPELVADKEMMLSLGGARTREALIRSGAPDQLLRRKSAETTMRRTYTSNDTHLVRERVCELRQSIDVSRYYSLSL